MEAISVSWGSGNGAVGKAGRGGQPSPVVMGALGALVQRAVFVINRKQVQNRGPPECCWPIATYTRFVLFFLPFIVLLTYKTMMIPV